VSASLLLVAVVALLYLAHLPIWTGIGITVAGFAVLEALFRRRLIELLLRITLALAIVGAVVLIVTDAALALVLAVVGVALLTLVDNLRELTDR
jgi:hypothetical protein